jgi:ankyrin repeat protein
LLATRLGYRATAALLIEAGADVTETDSTGRSALDWARDLRYQDLIALLEAAGN